MNSTMSSRHANEDAHCNHTDHGKGHQHDSIAEDIEELYRVVQLGGMNKSITPETKAPSDSDTPKTSLTCENTHSTLDVITRKYRLQRRRTDRKRCKETAKTFVCEHCGLKSRYAGFVKNTHLRSTSDKQSYITPGVQWQQQSGIERVQSSTNKDFGIMKNCGKEGVFPRIENIGLKNSVFMPYLCGICHLGFVKVDLLVKHVESCCTSEELNLASEPDVNGKIKTTTRGLPDDSIEVSVRRTRSGRKLGLDKCSASTKMVKMLSDKARTNGKPVDGQLSKNNNLHGRSIQERLKAEGVGDNINGDNDSYEDRTLSVVIDANDENPQNRTVSEKTKKKSVPNPHNECPICHKTFSQVSSLKRHTSLVHDGVKKHKCKTCHRRFQQKINLTHHKCIGMTTPVSKSLLCIMCGKSFSTVSALKHHENTLHIKALQYICTICETERPFTSAGNLREHIKSIHGGRSYLCDLCGKSFSFKNSCNRHRRHHLGLKPYQCRHCQKSYKSREGCKKHELTHIVPEQVQCEYCGRRMKNLGCVTYHIKKYHSGGADSRHYQCYRCHIVCGTGGDLVNHMKACQKNQYACHVCMKTFSSKSNLSYHLRIHAVSLDNSCPVIKQ